MQNSENSFLNLQTNYLEFIDSRISSFHLNALQNSKKVQSIRFINSSFESETPIFPPKSPPKYGFYN